MNRNVYTLLSAAILSSVLNVAQAETMEERKQRIMRKYMRERQDVLQSDFEVPNAIEEDARVVDSEGFKELATDFQREESVRRPQMVQPNQPVPVESRRNWWLETAEMQEDPFANPFSSKTDAEKGSADSWSPWGRREDSSIYGNAYGQQRDGRSGSQEEDFSVSGGASSQQWNRRGDTYPGSPSVYGRQNESSGAFSVSGMPYDGYSARRSPASLESDQRSLIYGRQQINTRRTDSGWGLESGGRYNSAPSAGLQQSRLLSPTDTQGWSSQTQPSGYTPYRNPYQVQGDEQRRYNGNLQPQQPQYSRPDNYQKWKDSNEAWDPTSGNSYLDELMRNERR